MPAHPSGDVPDELVLVAAQINLQAEHRVRQCFKDNRVGLNVFGLSHVFFATDEGL